MKGKTIMNNAVGKYGKLLEGKKPHERSRLLRALWTEAQATAIRAFAKSMVVGGTR